MSSKPWYAWFPSDYKSKTSHLSFIHDSAYRRLLDAYYQNGGPLPANVEALYRITGAQTDEERTAVVSVSREFFTNGDGKLCHARCDVQLDKERELHAKWSEAGKSGNQKRWGGDSQAIARRSDGDRIPSPQPSSTPTPTSNPQPTPKKSVVLPSWLPLETWKLYQEHRLALRAKLTDVGVRFCLRELDKLRKKGNDPTKVIERSIQNGWRGLFALDAKDQDGIDEWLEQSRNEKEVGGERLG